MRVWRTVREMSEGVKDLQEWIKWHRDALELFHAYAQRFGGTPGCDVFLYALTDALRSRGMTLEQFKATVERPKE